MTLTSSSLGKSYIKMRNMRTSRITSYLNEGSILHIISGGED